MYLGLGRKEASSIEVVLYLANEPAGHRAKAREIAEEVHISPSYLPQVLADLVRGGLLTARAGRNGGYQLARDPSTITLVDIIHASGEALGDDLCQLSGAPAPPMPCALHGTWSDARRVLTHELRGASITHLARAVDTLRTARVAST